MHLSPLNRVVAFPLAHQVALSVASRPTTPRHKLLSHILKPLRHGFLSSHKTTTPRASHLAESPRHFRLTVQSRRRLPFRRPHQVAPPHSFPSTKWRRTKPHHSYVSLHQVAPPLYSLTSICVTLSSAAPTRATHFVSTYQVAPPPWSPTPSRVINDRLLIWSLIRHVFSLVAQDFAVTCISPGRIAPSLTSDPPNRAVTCMSLCRIAPSLASHVGRIAPSLASHPGRIALSHASYPAESRRHLHLTPPNRIVTFISPH